MAEKTYIVTTREIWTQKVRVKAESPEDAIRAVGDGGSEYLDDTNEYSQLAPEETWTVEEET